MTARYEVVIAIESPWNAKRMLDVRSPWCLKRLCALLVRTHQHSPRAEDEPEDGARLAIVRTRASRPAVDVVYRVRVGDAGRAPDGRELARAAAAALHAFRLDFASLSPPLTAERIVVKARSLAAPGRVRCR